MSYLTTRFLSGFMRLSDAFSGFFPGHAAVGIGVGFGEATVEILSLLEREFMGFIRLRDAVPKLLDEFELLGRGELKEFFAKGVRCHGRKSAVGFRLEQVAPGCSPLFPS